MAKKNLVRAHISRISHIALLLLLLPMGSSGIAHRTRSLLRLRPRLSGCFGLSFAAFRTAVYAHYEPIRTTTTTTHYDLHST